ncbi:MAG TPA: transporter [Dyella sp.]|uniref:SphA family protein n=1 Tax=Dyella sp. TaxID=1869338 RepID=UPI002D774B6C|nr:transporter [Dyella sp.]HET6555393.1 transporter [Dyella sp.]
MRTCLYRATLLTVPLLIAALPSHATEGASGLYLLGGQSLNAGLTPAPGWYASLAGVQYSGSVGGSIQGGVRVVELKKRSDSFSGVLLYAPRTKFLGGQLAFSVGMPYAYLRLSGEVGGAVTRQRSVSGTGRGDTSIGSRLGWQVSPVFTHAIALTLWAPTGEYAKGFTPSIGHHRWAGDITWAFTYVPGGHHTELSAAIGYGVNGPNTVTHYRSGDEVHLELGIGQRLTPRFEVGLAGYVYRQVSADSGIGAFLGPLEGRVNGAGPAVNYAFKVGTHGLALTARYYHEFDAKRHFQGDLALASATFRF